MFVTGLDLQNDESNGPPLAQSSEHHDTVTVDDYRLIAVVDSSRIFTKSECVVAQD